MSTSPGGFLVDPETFLKKQNSTSFTVSPEDFLKTSPPTVKTTESVPEPKSNITILDTRIDPFQHDSLKAGSKSVTNETSTVFEPPENGTINTVPEQTKAPPEQVYKSTPFEPLESGIINNSSEQVKEQAPEKPQSNIKILDTRTEPFVQNPFSVKKPEEFLKELSSTFESPETGLINEAPKEQEPSIESKIVAALPGKPKALEQPAAAAAISKAKGTEPQALSITHSTIASSMKDLSPLLQEKHTTGNRVVVSIPDKIVTVYNNNGDILKQYQAYIGTSHSPTPRGQFRIMENIKPDKSEWYYGGHWLGFAKGYTKDDPNGNEPYAGFHGWVYDHDDDIEEQTNPGWKTSTHGCIQLNNKDLAEFSGILGAGDPVSIIDKPLNPPPPKPPLPKGLVK